MLPTSERLKGLEQCSVVQDETDRCDYIDTKYVLDVLLRCGGAIGVTRCIGQANNPILEFFASSITSTFQTFYLILT